MNICTQCASPFELNHPEAARSRCPYCGATVVRNEVQPWVDVARMTSLAEAGFLSDELIGLGIDAQIYQLEEFDASTHRRSNAYLIRVPTSNAQDAAARIREHLADDAAGSDSRSGFSFSTANAAIDPAFWKPVALMVLAGVASFTLGQQFPEQRAKNRVQGNSLPTAVDAIGRPLLTEPAVGQPRYRLSFDRSREAWYLDGDQDRDGRFESHQRFHATGASW